MNNPIPSHILDEMQAYYTARAPEYDEWWQRQGRYDRGSAQNQQWFTEIDEVAAVLSNFAMTGDLLELAPGTGNWTERLLLTATTITAVDASPAMIEINRARFPNAPITYQQADLFTWQPDRCYDGVFFGFWLSHVPLERLDGFLAAVASALRSGGKLFFIDNLREATATSPDQRLPDQGEQVTTRRLNDGRTFQIIKNFFQPDELTARFQRTGLAVEIMTTASYFLYGAGVKTTNTHG